jgi:hypothetical protein
MLQNRPASEYLSYIVSVALLAVLCLGCRGKSGRPNLLSNGDLTSGSGQSPNNWQANPGSPGSSVLRWNHPTGNSGELEIDNVTPNDAHWTQRLHLQPGWYHLSAEMRTESVPRSNVGGNLSVMEGAIISRVLYGNSPQQTVGFYLKVGAEGAEVAVACRLGGFSSMNTGKAFCRNLTATRVAGPAGDSLPRYDLDQIRGVGASPSPITELPPLPLAAGDKQTAGAAQLLEAFLDLTDRGMALIVVAVTLLMIGMSGGLTYVATAWRFVRLSPRTPAPNPTEAPVIAPGGCEIAVPQSLRKATAGFCLVGLLAACVGIVLASLGRPPRYLVFVGVIVAIAAWPPSRLLRGRAPEEVRVAGLTLSEQIQSTLAVFAAFLSFYALTSFAETSYNEQARQAFAFLHGHTYIEAPAHSYIEYYERGGYKYALQPPLAAILMMPLAFIFGIDAPQTGFAICVGAGNVALAWYLLARFRLNVNARVWLTLFYGVGTIDWYYSIQGRTWDLPFLVGVLFTLAALSEAFGRSRALWLGIFAGLAALARYELVLLAPIYAAVAYKRGDRLTEIFWMVPGFAAVGVVFIGLNELRYHTFFDTGILAFGTKDVPRFGLRFLPVNLYTIFFMAPVLDGRFPYLHPQGMGQGLTLTSPAFVLALRADWRRHITALMWLAVLLSSAAELFWYTNGFEQFGTRLYIQAFPFLLTLMALGTGRRADQLTKILVGSSIVLVGFGVWHIQWYGWG